MNKTNFLFVAIFFLVGILITIPSIEMASAALYTPPSDTTPNTPIISTRGHTTYCFVVNCTDLYITSGHTTIDYDITNNMPGLSGGVSCAPEIVIYFHGFQNDEKSAIENFNLTKESFDKNNYPHPIIGFSWDSDQLKTHFGTAEKIAAINGIKFAKFIVDLKDKCPDTKIHLVGHSLGARVILNSIAGISIFQDDKYKITSVHLLGAAVYTYTIAQNNFFGIPIENKVGEFYNLFNRHDNILFLGFPYSNALGNAGISTIAPTNYTQRDVTDELGITHIYNTGGTNGDGVINKVVIGLGYGVEPPKTGDWHVVKNLSIKDSQNAPRNVIVSNNAILTIGNNGIFGIDFTKYNLSVKDGSKVLIKNGGKIQNRDVDGDSIGRRIDLEPETYSDDFSNNQSPPTYGSIITRGDQMIDIFPDGNKIRLVASPNSFGGSDALIEMCGNTVLKPSTTGTDLLIGCSSIDIQVNSGAVDAVLDNNNNFTSTVTAILDESDSFFFDEESFTMRSNAGTAEITIMVEDGTTKIPLTEGNAVIVDHETSIITADPDNISDVTIIVDGIEEIIPPGASVVSSPEQVLENIIDDLNSIVSENAGSSLASKVVDASASVQTALDELNKKPSDNQAAAGTIEGAIGSLEDAIKDYGLDQTQGEQLIDQLLTVSRQLASNAISVATNTPGSDTGKISSANAALVNGDSLRIPPISFGDFKSAAAEYKTAIAEAEGALP